MNYLILIRTQRFIDDMVLFCTLIIGHTLCSMLIMLRNLHCIVIKKYHEHILLPKTVTSPPPDNNKTKL